VLPSKASGREQGVYNFFLQVKSQLTNSNAKSSVEKRSATILAASKMLNVTDFLRKQ
jgi:hypothetical protein